MRRICLSLLFIIFLVFTYDSHAQVIVGNYGIQYVPSAPSGTCSTGSAMQVVTSTGSVYTCQSGTWAVVGGGGGAPTTCVAGTYACISTANVFSSPQAVLTSANVVQTFTSSSTANTAVHFSNASALPEWDLLILGSNAGAAAGQLCLFSESTSVLSLCTTPAGDLNVAGSITAGGVPVIAPISNAVTSATGGTGISAVTCSTAACTNLRGTYTMTATAVSAGTILTLVWPTTSTAYACQVVQNGGAIALGLGHSVATSTGMTISNAVSAPLTGSIVLDYECQP